MHKPNPNLSDLTSLRKEAVLSAYMACGAAHALLTGDDGISTGDWNATLDDVEHALKALRREFGFLNLEDLYAWTPADDGASNEGEVSDV